MSTYSPNFNLVLATTSDQVNVVTHISGNFLTIDSLVGALITTTGGFKNGLFLGAPTISNPTINGNVGGVFSITASTGSFNTITATGGALTVNSFNIGTFALPSTIGATSQVMAVQTGNVVFVDQTPNTGANLALSNLASVAVNTSLNNFTAATVTLSKVIATSGLLTGLTSFQATTGTFAGLLTALGTITANVVNCTGGAATFSGVTIGTWALPSTIGATGQFLAVADSTVGWGNPPALVAFKYSVPIVQSASGVGSGSAPVVATNKTYDISAAYSTSVGTWAITNQGMLTLTGSVSGVLKGTGASPTTAYLDLYKNGALSTSIVSTSVTSVGGASTNYTLLATLGSYYVTSGDKLSLNYTYNIAYNSGAASLSAGNIVSYIVSTRG